MAKRAASTMVAKSVNVPESRIDSTSTDPLPSETDANSAMLDVLAEMTNDTPVVAKRPALTPLGGESIENENKVEGHKVSIPRNRIKPLKDNWKKIYTIIVEHLKLQVRFNTSTSQVELRKCEVTTDLLALQRAVDFLRAFALGFEIGDAEALVRIDELYLETFKLTDVKMLKGDHLARAIGRIAGSGGRNKHTIENSTKTRLILAGQTINILGSFQNCRTARRAICAQVMGAPNSKIHGTLRGIAERMNDR